ncbi:MAG TPA: FAD-dependent oxidoreductase [Chloroflexota bacterium]|nr:FAD-dependent oxidoreductase [Chloroflexota bacterium]
MAGPINETMTSERIVPMKARRASKPMAGPINETMSPERIVIVGASLAGLRAAEALRREGFVGHLTLIGDEPYPPYDRPPLSKQVLGGWPWSTPRWHRSNGLTRTGSLACPHAAWI